MWLVQDGALGESALPGVGMVQRRVQVSSCADFGSSGSCKGNAIKGCTVGGNVESAIEITDDCTQNRIEGNSIASNGKGLNIHGKGNYVAANVVVGNTDNYDFSQGNQLNILLGEIPESLDWACSVKLAGSLTCTGTGVNGITVNADNVTINLAGCAMSGPCDNSGSGIYQSPVFANLVVLDGMVVNWRGEYSAGVYAASSGSRISGIQAATALGRSPTRRLARARGTTFRFDPAIP